ncbi:MAG: AAC(3) family N-acetyltransferase [Thiohalocapsa sp. PB-PSB1]|nr:MAG: AAC(3) family N-acetyltransferase [Thiohalocapsa sp. PB-PSB1]
MLDRFSGLAVRHLSPERFAWLRGQYLKLRNGAGPLLMRLNGRFDSDELKTHLRERLGEDYQVLMVHSSVNALAPMYTGNSLQLLGMLIDLCGPKRTLVMPAFYFGDPRYQGAMDTFTHQPRLDLRRTPSQMGLLTELFRRWPGVLHSKHPVYRVTALGPLAAKITAGHELADTPTGRGTPFDAMAELDASILGIGKTSDVLTQVHHPESVLGDDFPVPWQAQPRQIDMTLVDGAEEIAFAFGNRALLWRRNMHKLKGIMGRKDLREWRFHGVPMFATRAGLVSRKLIDAAARGQTIYDPP